MPTVERMSKKLSDMGVLTFGTGDGTMKFEPGDYVKFELRNDETGEAEWMWLRIDYCDEPNRIIFGWLDSQPVVFTTNTNGLTPFYVPVFMRVGWCCDCTWGG